LGLDKEAYGQLMNWHSAGAIVGKLVSGLGADFIYIPMSLFAIAFGGPTTAF